MNSPNARTAIPAEKDILDIMDSVEEMELEAYEEETLICPGRRIGHRTRQGYQRRKGVFETIIWHLSNGIRVIVKPTDYKKDEVLLLSETTARNLPCRKTCTFYGKQRFCPVVAKQRVGPFKASELKRKLTGKIAGANPYIQNYTYGINGNGSPQDLETLLELVYAYIVTPRFEESEFEAPMAQLKALVPNLEQTPNYKLQKELIKTLFNNNPHSLLVSSELLEKLSVKKLEEAYRQCFGNMNGSTVTIVGNVDPEMLKPLVERYLGSLPSVSPVPTWKNDGNRIQKGVIENHFKIEMETPKTSIVNVYSADIENTLHNSVYLKATQSVLNMAYIQSLREDEGGTLRTSCKKYLWTARTIRSLSYCF